MVRRAGRDDDYPLRSFNENIWVQNGGTSTNPMKRGVLLEPLPSSGKAKMRVHKYSYANEQQKITVTGAPTGGTFTLTFDGQTTAAIPFNATKIQVQTALNGLTSIAGVAEGLVVCTGGPLPANPITVEFTEGLEETNVAQMTKSTSFTGGTSPAMTITTVTPGKPGTWEATDEIIKVREANGIPAWNEIQQITLDSAAGGPPTTGTLKITLQTNQTAIINFDASNLEIATALGALPGIGVSNLSVTRGPWPDNPVEIEFINTLAELKFDLMSVQSVTGGIVGNVIELQRPQSIPAGSVIVSLYESVSGKYFAIATPCRGED